MTMSTHSHDGIFKKVMNLKFTGKEIFTAIAFTVPILGACFTYVTTTFQTKVEAAQAEMAMNARVIKVENAITDYSKVQTQMFGDLREIVGILKQQQAERAHGK